MQKSFKPKTLFLENLFFWNVQKHAVQCTGSPFSQKGNLQYVERKQKLFVFRFVTKIRHFNVDLYSFLIKN